ncbi:MAG: lipopolysaccharide biosynthesis protein [Sphingobium sp.]
MMTTQTQDPDGFGIHPGEIAAILHRRRYWLIAPVLLGLVLSIALIAVQKPMYRSSATLLIDTQEIPTSVVASPLTNIANDRIAKIRQQITSRDSLSDLIARHRLYPEERAATDFPKVLEIMRRAIEVNLLGADQGGSGQGNTIAFTLSFTYRDAAVAQAVTADLTRRFLVEDKRFRTEQATGTAAFLGRRAQELVRQLNGLEDKRRGVEARYAGALPDQVALNAQAGAALRAELSRIDTETQGLVQQNGLLAARANETARAPTPEGDALRRSEERLTLLLATYSDDYPEVMALRSVIARQRADLRRTEGSGGSPIIETEIAAGRARIATLAGRRAQLVSSITDMEHRAAEGPQASYELNMIERDYDNIKRQYESLREKQLDAQVAANLQSEDKGERFSVIEQPSLPHESLGRKPPGLLLAGLVAGAAIGCAAVIGHEMLRGNIHGEATLARIMGAPPLGIIPVARPSSGPRRHEQLARWLASLRPTAILERR